MRRLVLQRPQGTLRPSTPRPRFSRRIIRLASSQRDTPTPVLVRRRLSRLGPTMGPVLQGQPLATRF